MDFKRSLEPMDLEVLHKEMHLLKNKIKKIISKTGYACDNVCYNANDLDEKFIMSQYYYMLTELEKMYHRLEYVSKDVVEEGYISHNKDKRYALQSGRYLTTGSQCEILYKNEETESVYWIYTIIQHNGQDYYAEELGKEVSIDGMKVRIRG
ncbi:hypothetical protein CO726_24875 [Bacillus fungorum]|uniref:DUF5348 domain-containing protein n=1 Tax=Bacillus fungorum TaxID=2039284 RepID=A0A2G6Q7K4_9BACI|nr:DUF5348 domain-containing protein [Bacillus fungorum]PIE92803.1 hypothetical protein CO726_24875 [Bacillus fungorum]